MVITKNEMNEIFPKGMRGAMFAADIQKVVRTLDTLGLLGGCSSSDTYNITESDALLDKKLNLTGGNIVGSLTINGEDIIVDGDLPTAIDPGDSTATTIAGLKEDYNNLLSNLRSVGIIA